MSFAIKFLTLLVVAVFIAESLSMPAESDKNKADKPAEKSTDKTAAVADEKPDIANDVTDESDGRRCFLANCNGCPPGYKKDKNGKCRKVAG